MRYRSSIGKPQRAGSLLKRSSRSRAGMARSCNRTATSSAFSLRWAVRHTSRAMRCAARLVRPRKTSAVAASANDSITATLEITRAACNCPSAAGGRSSCCGSGVLPDGSSFVCNGGWSARSSRTANYDDSADRACRFVNAPEFPIARIHPCRRTFPAIRTWHSPCAEKAHKYSSAGTFRSRVACNAGRVERPPAVSNSGGLNASSHRVGRRCDGVGGLLVRRG